MTNQLEINFNNDTANYRAHQVVLNLTQITRLKNISRQYDRICQK